MRKYLLVVLLIVTLFCYNPILSESTAVSQDSEGPGLREGPCMVYDPFNNQTVLFGGDEAIADTWFYNTATNTWSEHIGYSPPGRINAGMAYCSETNEMIMFGGLGDTRTWSFSCETQSWSQVSTSNNPGVHQSHRMVYDSVENVVILFGGITDNTMIPIDDTWIFDCETREWTEVNPSVRPLARYAHVMTFDVSIGKTVMAFGNNYEVGFLNDIWTFDVSTNTWSQVGITGTPNQLYGSSMVYDSIQEKHILFGGCRMDPSYEASDDTCEFDGETNSWIDREPTQNPGPRAVTGLSFDSRFGLVILHGGINAGGDTKFGDTWVYSYTSNTWYDTSISSYTPPTPNVEPNTNTSNQLFDLIAATVVIGVVGASIIVVIAFLRKKPR